MVITRIVVTIYLFHVNCLHRVIGLRLVYSIDEDIRSMYVFICHIMWFIPHFFFHEDGERMIHTSPLSEILKANCASVNPLWFSTIFWDDWIMCFLDLVAYSHERLSDMGHISKSYFFIVQRNMRVKGRLSSNYVQI